jgi:hypothetical protein
MTLSHQNLNGRGKFRVTSRVKLGHKRPVKDIVVPPPTMMTPV